MRWNVSFSIEKDVLPTVAGISSWSFTTDFAKLLYISFSYYINFYFILSFFIKYISAFLIFFFIYEVVDLTYLASVWQHSVD